MQIEIAMSNIAFKENRLQIRQELQRSISIFEIHPLKRRFRKVGPASSTSPSRVDLGKLEPWQCGAGPGPHGESSCGRGNPEVVQRPAPLRSGAAAIATGYRIALP